MQENTAEKISKKKFLTLRRGIILILLLVIIGVGSAIVSIFSGVIESEQQEKRVAIEGRVENIFAVSEKIIQNYVKKREAERRAVAQSLKKDAINVTADIQIFLQSLFIKHEADIARDNLQEVKRKRELLATFALQRFNTMTKEMLRLKDEVEKMQVGIDEVITQAETEQNDSYADIDYLSGVPSVLGKEGAAGKDLDVDKLKQLNILSKAVASSKAYQKNSMTKSEILKIRELRRYLEDKKLITSIEPVKLLEKSSPDIVNILPENSVLTVTEVGGKVLLSLGSDLINAEAVSAETSRSVLFQLLENNYQWVVNLLVSSENAPVFANIGEAAELIEENIGIVAGDEAVSAYFMTESGLIRVFPENNGAKSSLPEVGWKDILAAGIATYYQEKTLSLTADKKLTLGVCFELAQPDLRQRINEFIEASPQNVILLLGALAVLVVSFFVIGVLGWKGDNSQKVITVNSGSADIDIRSIKPQLGSLKRLQAVNRGHSIGGSRILDFTRNEALKELVRRVRKNSDSVEQKKESSKVSEKKSKSGSKTTAIRAHKAGLREYLK